MKHALVVVVALLTLSACQSWFEKPAIAARHDPVRTMCGAMGLIHWGAGDTSATVKQVKVHNAIRKTLCPTDRYGPEWYYDAE